MNKLIKETLNRKATVIFIVILTLFFGAYSYYVLPKQESPDTSVPIAMIVTVWPGATAKDVDELISKPISDELKNLDECNEIKAVSKENISIMIVDLGAGADAIVGFQEIRNRVTSIQDSLPTSALTSTVNTDLDKAAGIIISLSSDEYTYEQLSLFANQYQMTLEKIDGIKRIEIAGDLEKEVYVEINMDILNELSISILDVNNILKAQNMEIPSGFLETINGKIALKTPGSFESIDDVKNLIIAVSPQNGTVTRLGDIATISVKTEENSAKFLQGDKKAVLITGYFDNGKNIINIGDDIREGIDSVSNSLPNDLDINEVIYQPDDVKSSVDDFVISLIIGIILVICVVFLGMGLRNAIIISTAIPLSIFMTFIAMNLLGVYVHKISLAALMIALGILVDNAIVIADATQVKINEGIEKNEAAYLAAKEQSIPVFVATLIMILAVIPLTQASGPSHDFVMAIPQVLIISIFSAYLVAMFVTPTLCTIFLKPTKKVDVKESKLRKAFMNMLEISIKAPLKTIIILIFMLIGTFLIVKPMLLQEFLPFTDKQYVYLQITSEKAGDIQATEKLVNNIYNLLIKEDEITEVTSSIGDGIPKFYLTIGTSNPSADTGMMICKFDLSSTDRFKTNVDYSRYLQTLINEHISGGIITVSCVSNTAPNPTIVVNVKGENLEKMKIVAKEIQEKIAQINGVVNVQTTDKEAVFDLAVDIDEDKAMNVGITKLDIQSQINASIYGATPTTYSKNGDLFLVKVISDISNSNMLMNMKIKSSFTGKKIPLKQFANLSVISKNDTLNRIDGVKNIAVTAYTSNSISATTVENNIEDNILPTIVLPDSVSVTFNGERELLGNTMATVKPVAIVIILLIYIIMLLQFRSFVTPFIILITIPLSLIGSISGLFLFRQPFSFSAILGIIALVGLVVKNGILLIEYIETALSSGLEIREACIQAVDKRFNPIILGAVTTILGMLPLALSGSSLFSPMAISLMCGLVVATLMTLIIIPMLYYHVNKRVSNIKKIR